MDEPAPFPEEPAPSPKSVQKTGAAARAWIIVLQVVILLVLIWPTISDWIEESTCDGLIKTHQLTGRRICDKLPYADSIYDMNFDAYSEQRRDYWID